MNIGVMYYDDTQKRTLEDKIKAALELYRKKYDPNPDRCFVNISVLQNEIEVDGVKVLPLKYILLNHMWIGKEEKKNEKLA